MTCNPRHNPVPAVRREMSQDEAMRASRRFLESMSTRRSIRDFSPEPVDPELIRNAIATANTAPSGANVQPWRFVVVTDPDRKRQIRQGAEREEKAFYRSRGSKEWLEALMPLGTDWRKPFLEDAPYLIVVFEVHKGPNTPKPYYARESVGIAVGLLLAALHQSGLATLTHTPSPMGFLNGILHRPPEERPFVVIPVGKQAPDAQVPDLRKKTPEEVTVWLSPDQGSRIAITPSLCSPALEARQNDSLHVRPGIGGAIGTQVQRVETVPAVNSVAPVAIRDEVSAAVPADSIIACQRVDGVIASTGIDHVPLLRPVDGVVVARSPDRCP